jgi:hypothetical protein
LFDASNSRRGDFVFGAQLNRLVVIKVAQQKVVEVVLVLGMGGVPIAREDLETCLGY